MDYKTYKMPTHYLIMLAGAKEEDVRECIDHWNAILKNFPEIKELRIIPSNFKASLKFDETPIPSFTKADVKLSDGSLASIEKSVRTGEYKIKKW